MVKKDKDTDGPLLYEQIAKVCYNANKAYGESIGETFPVWEDAAATIKDSTVAGVKFVDENPDAGHDASHLSWMEYKLGDGWVYGPNKDIEAKVHPNLVPWYQLPPEQRAKDAIFLAIAKSLLGQ